MLDTFKNYSQHKENMFGRNPKRAPRSGDGSILDVVEIFPTIQGEGPFAGYPAVFIRLGGCNLACAFCDTEFETFKPLTSDAICNTVDRLSERNAATLVIITGGEPMRQPIELLCAMLLDRGFQVQIETNGTLYRALDTRVYVMCSPKAVNGTYYPLRPDVLAQVNALKFIVHADDPTYRIIPDVGQGSNEAIRVYVQPMDVIDVAQNQRNLAHALSLAQSENCEISLQLHKMIGVA